jgi:hypothetical protein
MSAIIEVHKAYKYRLYRCDKKDKKLRHKIFVASTIWNHFNDATTAWRRSTSPSRA